MTIELDHMGLSVSDFERAKAFYVAALKPLGGGVIMEFPYGTVGPFARAGLGVAGKPFFWITTGEKTDAASARRLPRRDARPGRRVLRRRHAGRRNRQRPARPPPALPRQLLRRLRARSRRPQHRGGLPRFACRAERGGARGRGAEAQEGREEGRQEAGEEEGRQEEGRRRRRPPRRRRRRRSRQEGSAKKKAVRKPVGRGRKTKR